MTRSDRKIFAAQLEQVGQRVNAHRLAAVEQQAPFVGGLLRAAEENLLLAFTFLNDVDGVPETEL